MKLIPKIATAVAAVARRDFTIRRGQYVIIQNDEIRVLSAEIVQQEYTTITTRKKTGAENVNDTNPTVRVEFLAAQRQWSVGRWTFERPLYEGKALGGMKRSNTIVRVANYFTDHESDTAENLARVFVPLSVPVDRLSSALKSLTQIDALTAVAGDDPHNITFRRGSKLEKFLDFATSPFDWNSYSKGTRF